MDAVYPRIFMFLRLSVPGNRRIKTKIREFRAFDRALSETLEKLQILDPDGDWDLSKTVVEYVDANSNIPLVVFYADDNDLIVKGTIPHNYQDRMLDPDAHLTIAWAGTNGADSFSILQRIRDNLKDGSEDFEFVIRGRTEER